jgi:hypothetical protein
MKKKVIWALAALNAVLLGSLLYRQSTATAQVGAAPRPGEYIMIPGEVPGGNSAIIYMVDETNRKLSARTYDTNRKQFFDMAPIDLDRVFTAR